jgi:hypothetical protein
MPESGATGGPGPQEPGSRADRAGTGEPDQAGHAGAGAAATGGPGQAGQADPGGAGAGGPGQAVHAAGQAAPGSAATGEDPARATAGKGGGHRRPDPWGEVMHLASQVAVARGALGAVVPAWRRRTRGERRWPVTLSVVVAIVLQILLPDTLSKPLPHVLLPALEGALGVGLSIANPVRIERRGPIVRTAAITLIVLISAANAVSAVLLIHAILTSAHAPATAGPLLTSGASIWATNVIAFGLWYWEFDRGGPVRRAEGTAQHPDLLFPQMASPGLAPADWEPHFVDYLYLSFTNATAFSPTDVMPLARWAKMTMAAQSAVSLAVGALVIARAVNIL